MQLGNIGTAGAGERDGLDSRATKLTTARTHIYNIYIYIHTHHTPKHTHTHHNIQQAVLTCKL